MPTRQEYINALKKAADAGDNRAANEIAAVLEQMDQPDAPPPQESESYLGGVQRRFGEAYFGKIAEQFSPELKRRLEVTRSPEFLGMGGDNTLARQASAALSQAARTGGSLIMEAAGVVIPDVVREAAGDAFDAVMATDSGKAAASAVSKGFAEYQEFAKENPRAAEEFETLVDVSALLSPRPDLINISQRAAAAKKAGDTSRNLKDKVAITGLLTPEKLDRTAQTRPVGVLNKTETWVPDDFDNSVIETVAAIPGIKPYGNVHENFRVMQDYVKGQKDTLDNFIRSQNKEVDVEDLNADFNAALQEFTSTNVYTLASKAAQEQFDKYVRVARKEIKENGGSLVGILNARRNFDQAVHEAGQSLDADVATYQVKAAKLVRGVMNTYLKNNTRGDDVKNLLDNQFRTLTALDTLVNKRNKEGKDTLARITQSINEATGITLPRTALSVIATLTLVTQPVYAGALAGAAATGYTARAIARHGKPAVLRAYGQMLSGIDRSIKSLDDKTKISALRADRQVIVAMLEEARAAEEEPNPN